MADTNPGDVERVSTNPGFKNSAGTLTDPTTVVLKWRVGPDGAVTTWTYLTDAQIVRGSVGLYRADITVTAAGLHYFRWVGTGAVVAAEEGTFSVGTYFP